VDAELYKQVYQHWFTVATAAQQSTGANCTFVMQHIPQSLVEKGNENGGNPLGLENIPQLCKIELLLDFFPMLLTMTNRVDDHSRLAKRRRRRRGTQRRDLDDRKVGGTGQGARLSSRIQVHE
jgi:hypothetical protein